ncbi:MAG TPA: dienelactone hydrolase family protein [Planctomycetota bacterium]|nr:dienelactone hydrolase family protein [Planctomycetota bacterium]
MDAEGEQVTRPVLRAVLGVAVGLHMLAAVPVLALAGLLLVHAATGRGRLFAVAVLAGLCVPVLLWLASRAGRRWAVLKAAAACGGLSLLLLVVVYVLTPDGAARPGASVRSCYSGATAYRRSSLTNLVPEEDQLLLGTRVMPAADRLLDRAAAAELRENVRAVYAEMGRSPEFERLGSVLDQSYRDVLFGKAAVGHFYEYIPAKAPAGRLPVVIFLHGSLGNFKGYLWVWKRIADQSGVAVVAPTFGAGNWDRPGGMDAVDHALRYCASHPRMDPSRIHLAGLSNGGRGVCLAANRSPEAYRGLMLISPVIDEQALLAGCFAAAWKDKPILIIHGADDNRVPAPQVREAAESLRAAGLRVETRCWEGQCHFLFFAVRDQVQDRIADWLKHN